MILLPPKGERARSASDLPMFAFVKRHGAKIAAAHGSWQMEGRLLARANPFQGSRSCWVRRAGTS